MLQQLTTRSVSLGHVTALARADLVADVSSGTQHVGSAVPGDVARPASRFSCTVKHGHDPLFLPTVLAAVKHGHDLFTVV